MLTYGYGKSRNAVIPVPERVAIGSKGVVVSAESYATRAGLRILSEGGNAVDSVVTVAFVLAVTYPQAGNIGGGGFALYFDGKKVYALDFRETAPLRATPDMYLDKDGKPIRDASLYGYRAVGVPGTVAGLFALHKRFGKLPWSRVLEPAIHLAEKGFPVASSLREGLKRFQEKRKLDPEFKRIFYRNGEPVRYLVQKDLARTLRRIAREGPKGFYAGPVARAIEKAMQTHHGLITRDDLVRYQAKFRKPLCFDRKEESICTMPLPSAGGWTLYYAFQTLPDSTILPPWHSFSHIHTLARRFERAFHYRIKYFGDPDFVAIPEFLFQPDFFQQEKSQLHLFRKPKSDSRSYFHESDTTTHISVIDSKGRAVSLTYTLNGWFGAGVIPPGTGVILNNEMDDFTTALNQPNMFGLIGGRANMIEPGKRMVSSMTPTIVFDKGRRVIGVLGAPGGTKIPTAVYQVLENLLVYEMTPESAVHAGRIHYQGFPDTLFVEPHTLSWETEKMLEGAGYTLKKVPSLARIYLIWKTGHVYHGVADFRSPGSALAQP